MAPLVLLLHGGFWRAQWDRRHTRPMAEALAARGCVVATPEYRRTGGGGGWPHTFDDVRRVVERLPELLDRAGRAVLAAACGRPLGRRAPRALAGVPGTPDRPVRRPGSGLRPRCRLRPGPGLGGGRRADGRGSRRVTRSATDAGDPMRRSTGDVPVTIVHGTADALVPFDLSRRYAGRPPRNLAGRADRRRPLRPHRPRPPSAPGPSVLRRPLGLTRPRGLPGVSAVLRARSGGSVAFSTSSRVTSGASSTSSEPLRR